MGDRTSVHNSKILAVWYASEAENLFNLHMPLKPTPVGVILFISLFEESYPQFPSHTLEREFTVPVS